VRTPPMCKGPVGLGAKRTRMRFWVIKGGIKSGRKSSDYELRITDYELLCYQLLLANFPVIQEALIRNL